MQAQRAALIDAVKPDLVTLDQPLILRFQACDEDGIEMGELVDIQCKYRSGLEGNWDNHQGERIPLQFKQYLPFLLGDGYSGIELGYQETVANADYLLKRDATGLWTSVSTEFNALVNKIIKAPDGSVYVLGSFTDVGDANGDYIVKIDAGGNISSLGTGLNNVAMCGLIAPNGNLYVGGTFTSAGGVAATARVAMWDGANWNSVGGGIANGYVAAMAIGPYGNIYMGGGFTDHGDANGDYITRYTPSTATYSSMGTGHE